MKIFLALRFVLSQQDNVDLGELMFSLCYLPTAGRLTITIIKARNLKAMDITGASGGTCLYNNVTGTCADGMYRLITILVLFKHTCVAKK